MTCPSLARRAGVNNPGWRDFRPRGEDNKFPRRRHLDDGELANAQDLVESGRDSEFRARLEVHSQIIRVRHRLEPATAIGNRRTRKDGRGKSGTRKSAPETLSQGDPDLRPL